MYPTKKADVDRHVEECLKKINNETERNLRCFSFAKQYFKIERYEDARRYVSTYLSVRPNSAEAHCLLGKVLEKLGKKEAALQAYTTSLRLDSKQNNLVIKVCELLASDDVSMDQSGAQYFCELAQSFDPQNPAIFNLKQKIIASQNDDPQEIVNLLLKELETRPTDVKLRVRLLKHLLQYNMIQEAYKHASDIESKDIPIFYNSVRWYETVAEVLVKYQRNASLPNSLGWEFWFLSVSVLDNLVSLTLDEHSEVIKSTQEYVNILFNFDQTLAKAAQNINDCPDKQLVAQFLNHYRAQLSFHLTTLVFKQAQKDLIKYREASNITLPLLFVAYHTQPPDLQSMWFNHSPENRRNLAKRWRKEAAYRCSQAGHILSDAAKDRKAILIEKTAQYSMGMWREQLFKKLFVTRDHQLKMKTSFFLTDQQLIEVEIRLPDSGELLKYDEEAQLLHPDSLHHHIWINLHNELSDVKCTVFDGLTYSIKHLKNCGAETLNILDVQAFIYAATICARGNLESIKQITYYNSDKPKVLPASVTQELATQNQNTFFKAAYKMYKNEYDSALDQLRTTLVEGIKILRCVDNGLDIKLLVTLANAFSERSKRLTKQSEIEFTEARAELYWKTALPILERLKNNQAVSYPPNKYFNHKFKEMSLTEICLHIETGKLLIGTQLMKKKEYEKALRIFEVLKDPYASFHQAQIYKHMADQQTSQNKENVTSEMRSQNIILLSRARDCLYLTLDRLREPSVDPKHPLNAQLGSEIEKIERLLSRIDPDCTNRNECDGMSDENVSSPDSTGDHYVTGYSGNNLSYINGTFTSRADNHNNHSTPYRSDLFRREARPSPERLDAQLRQLTASKDVAINHILEHNKMMVESHHTLVEELKTFKEAVHNLTATVEELKGLKHNYEELKDIKKSVTELKTSIDDLDNFKNITDMVYEMKKEIADLKKDINKPTQLSEEDIYGLANDYSADYNINSNLAAYNSSLYSNYQSRLPGAASIYGPPPLYPGMYPPMAYAYGGLGLPQPGTLPFAADQSLAPDFRAMSAALSQVQPANTFGQPLSNAALPSTSLGVGLLTGQNLAQAPTQGLFRDPKLPIATTQSAFPSITGVPVVTTPVSKAPPVNVVITTSDPLPSTKTPVSQPVLSVTIPPQHLKGNIPPKSQPHNYQIPLPTPTIASSSPSILSKPPPTISTQSLLSNVAPPVYSAVSNSKAPVNVSLGLQIEKTLEQTYNTSKNDSLLNKSNVSTSSVEEHDPCPDFKPIIPLPDEVPITTGEESETVLFSEHAKLFRYVTNKDNKEWKERGVGTLKILRNPVTGKIRILMRRDQVHKICANHYLTRDMTLTPMIKSDRAYIWAAHDFADEEVVLEKFCVRFKIADVAKKFFNAFEEAKKNVPDSSPTKDKSLKEALTTKEPEIKNTSSTSLGGFTFSSTPTFKPKSEPVVPVIQSETPKASPFSEFSFGKGAKLLPTQFPTVQTDFKPVLNQSTPKSEDLSSSKKINIDEDGHSDDFVPTAEFKPVVPLPELVNVKTGEENCEVLFESRAKLLRFDTSGEVKEWKERGIGVIKLLRDNTLRLVMRRDQVHKVCCNHQVLKNMEFKIMTNNPKSLTWCAKDFSEGVLKPETFAIKFKTEELANAFLKAITTAQSSLDENNSVVSRHVDKHMKSEPPKTSSGFGDKFKPAKGSWGCKNCYIVNDGKSSYCVACETPKNDTVPKKSESDASGAAFSFGVNKGPVTSSWGDAFKPKEGSWECKQCYIRNNADAVHCVSCENPKDSSIPKKAAEVQGVNLDTGGLKFSFGVPATSAEVKPTVTFTITSKPEISEQKPVVTFGISNAEPESIQQNKVTSSWGDAFKPKEGTWECKQCYIRNNADVLYCISCESPKDDTVPKKESSNNKGISLDTGGQKFTFGLPAATSQAEAGAKTATFTFGQSSIPTSTQFSFGSTTGSDNKSTSFGFKPNISTPATTTTSTPENKTDKFVFGSPQKHDFEFTPRSPRRVSTGQKDEESDCSYVEEESDNIYFKPVIPLPDKVEVKTGEEEEEVLYCHRAKLFRFTSGEWKERGLGDIKILKRKDNGKLRVLMRREQIFKICLNHALTADIKYLPKDDKTWLFCAADFSEGELANEQFCVRFKNGEIAQEFLKAVKDALADASSETDEKVTKPENKVESQEVEDDDDEVELISETKVTPEEEKEAIELGLPAKYMAYRQLPDCTCAQCKKDDEYLKDLFSSSKTKIERKTTPVSSVSITPTGSSLFSTPKEGMFTFKSIPTPKENQGSNNYETLKSLLSKPSLVVTPKITSSSGIFSSPSLVTSASQISSNIFGTPTSTSNLFGSKVGSSIFGTPDQSKSESGAGAFSFASQSTAPASPGIFGGSANSPGVAKSTGSLFGSNIFNTSSTTASFFGGTKSSESIFGSASTPKATSVFGAASSTNNSPSIFQTNQPTTGSIFGSAPQSTGTPTSTPSIFQSSGSRFAGASTTSTGSIFGSANPGFGNSPTVFGSKLIFGSGDGQKDNTPKSIFGAAVQTKDGSSATANLKEDDAPVLNASSGLSFASLAAKTNEGAPPVFAKDAADTTTKTPFSFLGAGAPVFAAAAANKDTVKDKSRTGEDVEEGAAGDDEYDPHYEPIVPLPDAIVVSTGEEDETPLFNERARLYRFDANTKEWKERGIGQMKILHHPINKTYRFLLRREQVHKVVLNQLITPELDLQPMTTCDKAWIWAGYNYTDDESALEKLAVRFKNCDLAKQFYKIVQDVMVKVQEIQANKANVSSNAPEEVTDGSKLIPFSIQNYGVEDVSSDEQQQGAKGAQYEDEDEDEEDDEDEDDDDDRTVMFMKRCTLYEEDNGQWKQVALGDLQVYYDPELYAARICVSNDSGLIVSNTLIGINTTMAMDKNSCIWKAVEWNDSEPHWRELKATFSSQSAAEEFHSNYLEGLNYASEFDVVDELPHVGDAETES